MPSWLLLLNTQNNVFSTDGDLYACTYRAWASISKFIIFLLEECWGSNPRLNEYSGLLKGYVCTEDYRYVWFPQNHFAGPCYIEFTQFLEGSALTIEKNILFWFYLPREYRQLTHHYFDLRRLLLGRVPFEVRGENEVLTDSLFTDSTLQTNSELYLLTEDSKDLLFYCIQSLQIAVEKSPSTNGLNAFQNSMIAEFPYHPFRCISLLETCNLPTDRVEGSDEVKQAITIAHTDEYLDVTCTLEKIKEEADDHYELKFNQEMQQNPDEQHLRQSEEISRHENLPFVNAKPREGPNSKREKFMSYRKLLCISKSYGELAAAKQYAERKLWGGVSSRVVPSLVLQCPGCSKFFPPSSPKSLWNMLTHMRRQHIKYHAKLLSSISGVLDILIPFMQKKIDVWNCRE